MTTVEPPNARECERCGRKEVWSDEAAAWVGADDEAAGQPHCVHEWDITGSYNPIEG